MARAGTENIQAMLKIRELEGNGDFRSEECQAILKEVDIVITNPPFSLFGEYFKNIIASGKKFIILGPLNALMYKGIFEHFQNNEFWCGAHLKGITAKFTTPTHYYNDVYDLFDLDFHIGYVNNACFFTNIEHNSPIPPLELKKPYNSLFYGKYDNFEAIEVSKTCDIPYDYKGVMGVSVSFFSKYNPDQFEIVGATESEGKGFSNGLFIESCKVTQPLINGEKIYKRIFIRRK